MPELWGWLFLAAALVILAYIADALLSPEPVVPDPPRSVRVECDPWSYLGRHRLPDEYRDSCLRTAPYVVNPPYRSVVATAEYPQIVRRELVNAYQGGEER